MARQKFVVASWVCERFLEASFCCLKSTPPEPETNTHNPQTLTNTGLTTTGHQKQINGPLIALLVFANYFGESCRLDFSRKRGLTYACIVADRTNRSDGDPRPDLE